MDLLSVCPVHLHFLFFILFSVGSCLVHFQSVVLGTLSLMKIISLLCVFFIFSSHTLHYGIVQCII